MIQIRIYFILLMLKYTCSICNECNTQTHIQCTDINKYRMCNPLTSLPNTEVITCPAGMVCNSVEPTVCAFNLPPECNCGVCSGTYTCVSDTQFAFCSGTVASSLYYTCPINTKCNANDGNVPPNYCTETGTSDCPKTSNNLNCTKSGRFPISNSNCRAYYLCVNNVYYNYTCPYGSLFDPMLSKCSITYVCSE